MDGTVTIKHPNGVNERVENNDETKNKPCSQEFIPPRMVKSYDLQGQLPAFYDENETNYPKRRIQASTVTIEEID